MNVPLLKEEERYTYTDLLKWDEDFRAELYDGDVIVKDAPVTKHQIVSGELFFQLRKYAEGKTCKVIAAPFGVRLFPKKDRSDNTFFEPDIVVVCDPAKLDEKGCFLASG
jgi:Uma2 family endonuclease